MFILECNVFFFFKHLMCSMFAFAGNECCTIICRCQPDRGKNSNLLPRNLWKVQSLWFINFRNFAADTATVSMWLWWLVFFYLQYMQNEAFQESKHLSGCSSWCAQRSFRCHRELFETFFKPSRWAQAAMSPSRLKTHHVSVLTNWRDDNRGWVQDWAQLWIHQFIMKYPHRIRLTVFAEQPQD